MSRSTWACELKFQPYHLSSVHKTVTLHVSVWVEILRSSILSNAVMSRSTWACELKLLSEYSRAKVNCHAPRERVSWNFQFDLCCQNIPEVTLHVSVWVEIWNFRLKVYVFCVTLHVSVWVEISWWSSCHFRYLSRSTWACELKFPRLCQCSASTQSRSTWACELKSTKSAGSTASILSRSTWACELKYYADVMFL